MPPASCAGSYIFFIANRGLMPPGYYILPAQALVLIFRSQLGKLAFPRKQASPQMEKEPRTYAGL